MCVHDPGEQKSRSRCTDTRKENERAQTLNIDKLSLYMPIFVRVDGERERVDQGFWGWIEQEEERR